MSVEEQATIISSWQGKNLDIVDLRSKEEYEKEHIINSGWLPYAVIQDRS